MVFEPTVSPELARSGPVCKRWHRLDEASDAVPPLGVQDSVAPELEEPKPLCPLERRSTRHVDVVRPFVNPSALVQQMAPQSISLEAMTPLIGKGLGPFAVIEAGRIRDRRWPRRRPALEVIRGIRCWGPSRLLSNFDAVSRPGGAGPNSVNAAGPPVD